MSTISTLDGVSSVAQSAPPRPRKGRRRVLAHVALIAGALVMLYPLIWMISSSLKPESEIFSGGGLWPRTFDLGNYAEGWNGIGQSFGLFLVNSAYISFFAILGNVISCSMAAYAFARLDFGLKRLWFAVMLGTVMLPQHVTLVPQYTMFNALGWINSYLPLIVPHFLGTAAFFVFLLVQFIRGLPGDLDDAARVDGCGPVRTYLYIIMPLLKPALVTTVIFTFIWSYNDFFSQLLYISDANLFTVPLGLRLFLDATGQSAWGPMFAMAVLSLVPVFAVFLFFQRHIVNGIATTGLK